MTQPTFILARLGNHRDRRNYSVLVYDTVHGAYVPSSKERFGYTEGKNEVAQWEAKRSAMKQALENTILQELAPKS